MKGRQCRNCGWGGPRVCFLCADCWRLAILGPAIGALLTAVIERMLR